MDFALGAVIFMVGILTGASIVQTTITKTREYDRE